jgi:hypothetical protein
LPTIRGLPPWTTLASYCESARGRLDGKQLVDHVAPIQLGIRLLIPQGSRMLELDEIRQVAAASIKTLTYRWVHRDPAVDRLPRGSRRGGRQPV